MRPIWAIVIVLLLLCFIGVPSFGMNHGYGWYPSGIGGIVLIVLLILLLTGRL